MHYKNIIVDDKKNVKILTTVVTFAPPTSQPLIIHQIKININYNLTLIKFNMPESSFKFYDFFLSILYFCSKLVK